MNNPPWMIRKSATIAPVHTTVRRQIIGHAGQRLKTTGIKTGTLLNC